MYYVQFKVPFRVRVDLRMTFDELVTAGDFDQVGDQIDPILFPHEVEGSRDRQMWIIRFGRVKTTEEVREFMCEYAMRPATFQELCAFAAYQRDLQREFPIMGLGSPVSQDPLQIPALMGSREHRSLVLWEPMREGSLDLWPAPSVFLAVRK